MSHKVNGLPIPTSQAINQVDQTFDQHMYDAFVHPYFGFSPFTDHADQLNPIIEHLDSSKIDPVKLGLQLNQLDKKLLDNKSLNDLHALTDCLTSQKQDKLPALAAQLSGALKRMKLATAGSLSCAYRLSSAEEILYNLNAHLQSIQDYLTKPSDLEQLPQLIETTFLQIDKVQKEQARFFYNKKLSSKQTSALQKFYTNLEHFNKLPKSLQKICTKSVILSEKLQIQELIESTREAQKIIQQSLKSQESLGYKLCSSIDPRRYLKQGAQKLEHLVTPSPKKTISYLEVLRDVYDAQDLETTLKNACEKELITLCNQDLPGFKAWEDLLTTKEVDNKECMADVLKDCLTNKKITFSPQATLEDLIEICHLHQFCQIHPNSISIQNPAPSTTTFLDLFNHAGSIPPIFIIDFIDKILNSQKLADWIKTQAPETKLTANTFLQSVKQYINQARSAQLTYEQAIANIKQLAKEYPLSLYGFNLPSFDENPALTAHQARETVESLQHMHKLLEKSETGVAEAEHLSQEQIQEKFQAEKAKFKDNLHDFLVFKVVGGFFLGKKDATFHHIKKAQNLVAEPLKPSYFYNEIKSEIEKSSLGWFSKKFLLICLPSIHRFIDRYTHAIIENFFDDLSQKITSLNKNRLITRTSNCLSQYNALLKTWADKAEGGDKDLVIGQLMQDKRFLTFGDVSFSQKELYEKLSSSIAYQYIDLFKGAKDYEGPSRYFSSFREKINQFVKAPVFNNRRNFMINALDKLCVSLKALFIGAPAHALTFAAAIPVWIWETTMNKLVRKAAKSYLSNSNILSNAFDVAKKDIFDNNTYVLPITSFFADQFELLSKKLAAMSLKKDLDSTDPQEKFVISDKSRAQIKTTFENLFEVIKKNGFHTQDELKEFLNKQQGAGKLKDDVDNYLTSFIIDNIIEVTFTAYNEMLSEQSLQGSFLHLLESLNESLVNTSSSSKDKKIADEKKNQLAQEKMNIYSERVLSQIIDLAIRIGVDKSTSNNSHGITSFISWLKSDAKKLIKCYDLFIKANPQSLEDKLAWLKELRFQQEIFQRDLENKFERVTKSSSSNSQELKAQLQPVFHHLKILLDQGLQTLVTTQEELQKIEHDMPHFQACNLALKNLQASLEDLNNDDEDSTYEKIRNQYDFLENYLPKLKDLDEDLQLERPANVYANVQIAISGNLESFKEKMQSLSTTRNVLRSLKDLQDKFNTTTQSSLIQWINQKKESLHHGALYHLFHKASSNELRKSYQGLLNLVNSLDSSQDDLKQLLKNHLERLMQATTKAEILQIQQAIGNINFAEMIENYKNNRLIPASNEVNEVSNRLESAFDALKGDFDQSKNAQESSYKGSYDALNEEYVSQFKDSIQQLKQKEFINVNLDSVDLVKNTSTKAQNISHAMVYQIIKPKMHGALDLLRNGNFAQFLFNHALAIPLVTQ